MPDTYRDWTKDTPIFTDQKCTWRGENSVFAGQLPTILDYERKLETLLLSFLLILTEISAANYDNRSVVCTPPPMSPY